MKRFEDIFPARSAQGFLAFGYLGNRAPALAEAVRHALSNGQKASNDTRLFEEAAKRLAREEAGRSIRELRKGNVLGSDLTIRHLIEEGRRF